MKASDERVGRFIGNSETVFIIPPFQRNYSWDEEQCCELFDDALESAKNNKSHYIGNVVYYIGENSRASFTEYVLIDGQQRITSILLLLCALRERLPDDEVKKLEKKFLINEDETDEKYRVKLKQTDNDLRVFEKIINIKNSSFTAEEKQNRLYKNYDYFSQRLMDLDTELIDPLYKAIVDLEIVDLNLQIEKDLEAVQKIFEKINSTGKELSVADLIRNYLLITNNIKEQKRLYDNYWVKIEDLYQDKEKISDFAKNYLITKRCVWVEEKKMYSTFKSYFNNSDLSKEDILNEILVLSKYYNWFIDENCPNAEITATLKELNVLKSGDMYSLLLVLFDELYDTKQYELNRILGLLCDFMIRYRIVSPVNGSSDIRRTIFSLLSKLTKKDIEFSYDSILKELSNSPSPGGRFPDNEEFKESLSKMVNISYAKALLYKLDYIVARNDKVDIKKVTVEHLMPQTLTNKWKEYLGGEGQAETIYNTYLNNIGNLALLSRPMNSANSNDIWENKIKNLNDASFKLTNSIPDNDEWAKKWNDVSIKERCDYIIDLALNNITGPLKRERAFETAELNDEFVSGIYELSSINFDVTGRSAKSLIFDGKIIPLKSWISLLIIAAEICLETNDKLLEDVVKKNRIHKSTFKSNYYLGNDPIFIFGNDSNYVQRAIQIGKSDYYIESKLSAERVLHYTIELLKIFNLQNRFKLELE